MNIADAMRVKQLLEERDGYLKLLEISSNYDSKMAARISSYHNNNKKRYIERFVDIPVFIQGEIIKYIQTKIDEIEKEINSI